MKAHRAKGKINERRARYEKWNIPSLSARLPSVDDQNNPSLRILNRPNSKPHHPIIPCIVIEPSTKRSTKNKKEGDGVFEKMISSKTKILRTGHCLTKLSTALMAI